MKLHCTLSEIFGSIDEFQASGEGKKEFLSQDQMRAIDKLRSEYLQICENNHKKLYIHKESVGNNKRRQINIEELVRTAKFIIFQLGGERMITLKAVGPEAVANMNLIAERVTVSIQQEGLYNIESKTLPNLQFGNNGPIYQCIELRVLENDV